MKETVREKDIFILADVGNYNITYNMHGYTNYMGPDEHYQDIKRVISAMSGHASKINVIMPLLYQSRQHKRKSRESLDCAVALRELEKLKVNNIITYDVHDPSICNAIPYTSFNNVYPTKQILESLMNEYPDIENMLVISPNMGAIERARYYADLLRCDVGAFYKRRDLTKVVNGKNPIIEHAYIGSSVEGKNIIVVDDMISSGSSMLEVCEMLKERGAKNIYLAATFALFTEGTEIFQKAYEKGLFNKIYSTNASFIPQNIIESEWFELADISFTLAQIINDLHNKKSLHKYLSK
ncbi:MAG: ribose-phosphate diphosphokinase [Bacilli bacterium]|nr:ribose-phosphate diphosphokinase [Bacilli bacterium]